MSSKSSLIKEIGNDDDDIDVITRLLEHEEHQHYDDDDNDSDSSTQLLRHNDCDNERQRLLPCSSSTNVLCCRRDTATNYGGITNNEDHEKMLPKKFKPSTNFFIYMVTMSSAIGGFLFGYDTGIVSGAMVFIRDYFHLNNVWQEFIVSATILSAWLFSLIAGYLTNRFGRKIVILLASFIFTVGGVMMALSESRYVLLAGRFTVGSAIGLASMAIPIYIAEVAPVDIRGKLVTINNLFITFGQFVASVLAGIFSHDPVHGWRYMLGLASVPSILQLIFFLYMPESPRWYIQKGHYEKAYESLEKLRSSDTSPEEIKAEFELIKENYLNSQRQQQESTDSRMLLNKPSIRRALFIGCSLQMFQQLSGINTVMYYSATIIQMSGVRDNSLAVWLASLTASINFLFTFVGIVCVERCGRRILILSSLTGVIVSLLLLASGFELAENNSPPVSFHYNSSRSICSVANSCNQCIDTDQCGFCFIGDNQTTSLLLESQSMNRLSSAIFEKINGTCLPVDKFHSERSSGSWFCSNGTTPAMTWSTNWCPSDYSWMTLVGLMLYLLFFAPGMGPMPWTINSEIYPLYARSFCYSISTSVCWFFNLLVSLTFLSLTQLLTKHGAFYLYSSFAIIGWIVFYLFLPETKGKSLEEIELYFERPLLNIGKKLRRYSRYSEVPGSDSSATVQTVQTVQTNATTSSSSTDSD